MALPFFYISDYTGEQQVTLNEETSRHVVQVLRMKEGENLNLTDGRGNLLNCEIIDANKKHCVAKVIGSQLTAHSSRHIAIAISLLKNPSRFEWFLEKATEIGVSEIIPLICERTEKEKFRHDRMNAICISAMLQSQQCWLPVLHEPVKLIDFVNHSTNSQKFIAHCVDENSKEKLTNQPINLLPNQLVLIGPEGDFTDAEIQLAVEKNFVPVSLGTTRLRTETAGLVAAVVLNSIFTA